MTFLFVSSESPIVPRNSGWIEKMQANFMLLLETIINSGHMHIGNITIPYTEENMLKNARRNTLVLKLWAYS
jgi:hypothetical protein